MHKATYFSEKIFISVFLFMPWPESHETVVLFQRFYLHKATFSFTNRGSETNRFLIENFHITQTCSLRLHTFFSAVKAYN